MKRVIVLLTPLILLSCSLLTASTSYTINLTPLAQIDTGGGTYDFMIDEHVGHSQREIELARAMQDKETVIREQIKMETLKFSRDRLKELQMLFTRSGS